MKECSILILLLMGIGCLPMMPASAADITLTSKPSKCVSLKQGNICYQNIAMQWKASEIGDYCLYNLTEPEPIKCWQGQDHGEHRFEFSFSETQQYVMRQQGDNDDLAVSTIEVKWVYKVRRSQFSWRVF